jgi:hypothetical protein
VVRFPARQPGTPTGIVPPNLQKAPSFTSTFPTKFVCSEPVLANDQFQ